MELKSGMIFSTGGSEYDPLLKIEIHKKLIEVETGKSVFIYQQANGDYRNRYQKTWELINKITRKKAKELIDKKKWILK